MAFSNFCCRSGGSNLNAGTRTGNTTEPGTSADFTYASGNWVQSTGVFTVASGNPSSDGVAVGDFASVYADGSSVTGFVGRVTARDATTITVSLTAKAGTAPTDGTGNRTLKIGGAWAGPNGASAFPFAFVQSTLMNAANDVLRVNLKNDATYNITATMTHLGTGRHLFQGYTTAYGDLGRATIDGGTSGASYIMLQTVLNGPSLADMIFQNNGATGTNMGVDFGNSSGNHVGSALRRVVVNNVKGTGIRVRGFNAIINECEAYSCGGFGFEFGTQQCHRCISHDNAGGGFLDGGSIIIGSIADSNTGIGFSVTGGGIGVLVACDAYNNTSDGIRVNITGGVHVENCNAIKNGGYGIQIQGTPRGNIRNCGFGAGTQANTSGTILGDDHLETSGNVTYANDVTPWVDPANGDFRINLAAAKGAGRGAFTQTAGSYAGTISYPDIGAAQHQETDKAVGYATMSGGLQ